MKILIIVYISIAIISNLIEFYKAKDKADIISSLIVLAFRIIILLYVIYR